MQQVSGINRETVSQFVKRHLAPDQSVRSDALPSLAQIGKTQNHAPRVTPPNKAGEWLPWVHIAIGNLKRFCSEPITAYRQGICKSILTNFAIVLTEEHGNMSYQPGYSMRVCRILRLI